MWQHFSSEPRLGDQGLEMVMTTINYTMQELAERLGTAIDAIEESVRHTCCVTMDDAPGLREDLLVRCDDDAENGPEHEFWGTDDEGNDWRVHVRIAEWRD